MAIRITATDTVREVRQQLTAILGSNDRITVTALNRSAAWARTRTVRELAASLNVPQKTLRKRVRIYRARRRQTPIRASLWIGLKRPITAAELSGTVTSTATGTVKIGRRIFKQAFIATMPGGHSGVFTRKPGARHRRRPDGQYTQLPIQESVAQLWPDAERVSRQWAEKAYREVYPREMRRLLNLQLQQRG